MVLCAAVRGSLDRGEVVSACADVWNLWRWIKRQIGHTDINYAESLDKDPEEMADYFLILALETDPCEGLLVS